MDQQVEKKGSSTAGLVLGILAIVFGALSFIPVVGSFTVWIAIIPAVVGLTLSIVKKAKVGMVLNIIAILMCVGAYMYQVHVAKNLGYLSKEMEQLQLDINKANEA